MARLGDMLLGEGLISRDQLDEALELQKKDGGFLGRTLVTRGFLKEEQLVQALARQSGAGTIDLDKQTLDPALAQILPKSLAEKFLCVPVTLTRNLLHVAIGDPTNDAAMEALGFHTNKTVKAFVAGPASIERAWKRVYGVDGAAESPSTVRIARSDSDIDKIIDDALGSGDAVGPKFAAKSLTIDLEVGADAPPVIKLVNGLLLKAVRMRASDLHVEPCEENVRVRFRIDGVLHPITTLPASFRTSVASRLKVMAQMDVAERRFPQDGRMKVVLEGGAQYDFRLSCLPSVHGEKMVVRVLGQGSLRGRIEELGFRDEALAHVQGALKNPFGMILATGPTGSGKTTTLYTFLSQLNTDDVNIVTAEDPVEYNLAGITQVNVRPQIGYTFDLALRAFLRQDPDIILVGEMRDFETGSIAIKAALTGHLVLSTLHTNDAPSTAVRLIDMGIEPYLVASALKIVIAQRLVRRICDSCREEATIAPADRTHLSETELSALEHTFRGAGCESCNKIGYRGRAPVHEVMPVFSKEMKRIITEGGTEIQVAQVARREGMMTLKDNVLRMVDEGVTSLDEAFSIILAE